jgi:hypothetical protein
MRRQDGAQFGRGPLGMAEGIAGEEVMGSGHGPRPQARGEPILPPVRRAVGEGSRIQPFTP